MNRFDQQEVTAYIRENKIKALALDFFDTVIYRTIHPEYVKHLSAKRFILKTGINISPEIFYEFRSGLEIDLCDQNKKEHGSLEFNLDELAEKIASYFERRSFISRKELAKVFIETELQVEFEVLRLNEDILSLIREVREMGVDVYILSDFYIPKKYFKRIIKHLDIEEYITDLFVSCDFRKTKRSGVLYGEILNKLKLDANEVVMMGDNQLADVDMAEESGVRAYLVDNGERAFQYQEIWEEKTSVKRSKEIWESQLKKIFKKQRSTLFPEISVVLYSFIENLYYQLRQEGFKEAFFCSKEGYFLKELFDYYQDKYIGEEFIKSHYIKVSRRSTFLPSLKPLEEEDFFTIFRQYTELSVNQFLKNFNLPSEEEEKILASFKDSDTKIVDFHKSKEFSRLKKNRRFADLYEKNRVEQKRRFNKYIKGMSIEKSPEEIAIVDVGWKGTIQEHMYKIFDGEMKISGKYVGLNLVDFQNLNIRNSREGIIFTNNPGSKFFDQYIKLTSLFEILLAAPHGSAVRYVQKDDKVEVECEDIKEEREIYEEITKGIQESLSDCFKEILKSARLDHRFITRYSKITTKFVARILYMPSRRELRYYRDMKHFENFALFNYSTFARKEGILSSRYIKEVLRLLLSFKWVFSSQWGVFAYYKYNLYWVGKVLGELYYRKFVKTNTL